VSGGDLEHLALVRLEALEAAQVYAPSALEVRQRNGVAALEQLGQERAERLDLVGFTDPRVRASKASLRIRSRRSTDSPDSFQLSSTSTNTTGCIARPRTSATARASILV